MGTPKKPVKKKIASKTPGAKNSATPSDPKERKKIVDDEDDDEDFDMPLDELSGYESFDGYEEEDDY